MRLHFETQQWLPYPHELVFAFFANPENLPRLMPRWQRARIEQASFAPPPPRPAGSPRYPGIAAGSGTTLTLTVRPFPFCPIRVPWDALIEDFLWNHGFCDVQVSGPFRYWRHCHSVSPATGPANPLNPAPGTLLKDEVAYELPLGPLSSLADRILVRRQLASTFRYRQRRTAELLALATAGTA
jgi:ligand-binding SRPBCC domain-containing protein